MSGSVNKVTLIGNLGRDPEVRTMNSGDKVVSFSIATAESWRDKTTGEKRDKTEWHNIVIWNEHIGKVAEQYCKKGSKVYLEGQLQTREYTDRDGNQRRTTEIVLQKFRGELTLLGDPKGAGEDDRDRAGGNGRQDTRQDARQDTRPAAREPNAGYGAPPTQRGFVDDDIPF